MFSAMINKLSALISPSEALAVIGAGLFVFGVWQIYRPAAFLVAGCLLMAPFCVTLRRAS